MNENIDSPHGHWRPGDLMDRVIADLKKLAKMDKRELQYLKHRKLLLALSLIVDLVDKVPE